MKDPMRAIERFCNQHPRFGIPNLMRYIAIGNVFFWLLGLVNPTLISYMSFSPGRVLQGEIWRLISFFFIPESFNILGLITIYFYYWIGSTLERQWGPGLFTIYFFSGALLTMLYGILMTVLGYAGYSYTPTYVYLAMFFAFAVYYPDVQILLFFILPIKIKYLAYLNAAFFVYGMIVNPFPVNLLPLIAMLNFIIYCGGELLQRMGIRRSTPSAINFRRESKRIRKEQAQALYRHKCAVCGRTERDHPELEFRYCSRCQGYHCFCEEHINNHIHFTE